MDQERRRRADTGCYITGRHNKEESAGGPRSAHHVRHESISRLQEEEIGTDDQDHPLQCEERTQVRKGDGSRSHRPYAGDARVWLVEDGELEALQFRGFGCSSGCWRPTSAEQGPGRVQEDFLPPGLRRDANEQVRSQTIHG